MKNRATALTGAAGEHYVACKLSHLGYPVAMTRGGSPTVDLMVGDISGNATISIQVKTSSYAQRVFKRDPKKNIWLWDVGEKAGKLKGDNIIYAFVDLKGDFKSTPDVFLVRSESVHQHYNPLHSRHMFGICKEDGDRICNNWDLITRKLGKPDESVERTMNVETEAASEQELP